jgi:SAM-dependent methyltransferase
MPLRDDRFDMLSMGFALRHVAALETTFAEYRRVLKPGGRLLLLEVSRPRSAATRWVIRVYFQRVLRGSSGSRRATAMPPLLMEYYWDTIDECVPPATILAALRQTGFVDVEHRIFGGCLSEYLARKPAAAARRGDPGRRDDALDAGVRRDSTPRAHDDGARLGATRLAAVPPRKRRVSRRRSHAQSNSCGPMPPSRGR